jgi:hypothetical protein
VLEIKARVAEAQMAAEPTQTHAVSSTATGAP